MTEVDSNKSNLLLINKADFLTPEQRYLKLPYCILFLNSSRLFCDNNVWRVCIFLCNILGIPGLDISKAKSCQWLSGLHSRKMRG